jgi:hypothetical protein
MPNSTYPILSDGRFGRRLTRAEINDKVQRTAPFAPVHHNAEFDTTFQLATA